MSYKTIFMLICNNIQTKNGKNAGDVYRVLTFNGPDQIPVTLPNGETQMMMVKPTPVTVTAWVSREGTNAKLEAEDRAPITREGEYDFLQNISVGVPVRGVALPIDHLPQVREIGGNRVSISQTTVLVNAMPEDLDFNVAVSRACKAQGIVPTNVAFQAKNFVVEEITVNDEAIVNSESAMSDPNAQ